MARRGMLRSLCAALLLVAVWALWSAETGVHAQRVEITEREVDVVSGEDVAALDDATRIKKTVTITRARVAATIETTRIAGSGVHDQAADSTFPETGNAIEECRPGESQCLEDPADAMPTTDESDNDDNDRMALPSAQETATLEALTQHVKELEDYVRAWLPRLQAMVDNVIEQLTQARDAVVAKWRVVSHECVVFYNNFLADTVDALRVLYHRIAAVVGDVYAVVKSWFEVIAGHACDVWETHEEVRIVTRHVVSVLLLALLGAVFFSVYALVATVPDTVSTMWTTLDDLTRAQLKIVLVLVTAFLIYHLRSLWTFWLLLGSITTFYYWSGHVLAKTMKPKASNAPLARQASERMPGHAVDTSALRRTKSLV